MPRHDMTNIDDMCANLNDTLGQGLKKTASAQNKVALAGNEHRFERVAFDLYHNKENHSIWQAIEENGTSYLVRTDMPSASTFNAEASSPWKALIDKQGTNITLAYKNTPICRLASREYQFTKDNVADFRLFILNKMASKDFVQKLLNEVVDEDTKAQLKSTHPELF